MGSNSSKSNKTENLNNSTTSSNKKSHHGYQTSVFGWGRLKHPFKPDKVKSPAGVVENGHDHVYTNGDGHEVSDSGGPRSHSGFYENNESPNLNLPQSHAHRRHSGGFYTEEENQTIITTPIKHSSNGSTKENDENQDQHHDHHHSQSSSPPGTPKHDSSFKKQVLSNPSFYGHYRCTSCGKYWTSGYSKVGCTQDCSKCGTPTTPRR